MELKYYICRHCGNIIEFAHNSGVPVICCGERMEELIPGTVDASREKHVPAVKAEDHLVTVDVGSVTHPMEEKHYIEWIAIATKKGSQRVDLKAGEPPRASFILPEGDSFEAAYAYCNLHGLWKA